MSEWLAVEAIVRQRDKEKTAHAVAKLSSESGSEHHKAKGLDFDGDIENDVFEENGFSDLSDPEEYDEKNEDEMPINDLEKPSRINKSSTDSGNVPDAEHEDTKDEAPMCSRACDLVESEEKQDPNQNPEIVEFETLDDIEQLALDEISNKSSPSDSSYETVANDFADAEEDQPIDGEEVTSPDRNHHSVIITNPSIDIINLPMEELPNLEIDVLSTLQEEVAGQTSLDALQEPKSACVSPASSNGGVYTVSFSTQSI